MAKQSIAIAGAGGRMGQAIIAAAAADDNVRVVAAWETATSPLIGKDIGALSGGEPAGVKISPMGTADGAAPEVVIDFTVPDASMLVAAQANETGCALVIGTTGFSDQQEDAIRRYSENIAVVKSGNMSLGVNLLAALVEQAAAALPIGFDIEIEETHHHRKIDAPSGTALMIGEAAARGRNVDLSEKAAVGERVGARARDAIGFSVMRGGGVVGDHSAHFMAEKEIVTLSHRALDRSLFAEGAVAAATWAAGRSAGFYDMRSVLGLS